MKVLLINGSPHPRGCTDAALRTVAGALEERGLEEEILHLGAGPVRDCAACGACKKAPGRCAFDGDIVNILIEKAREADGFVFGSPVYYAGPSGQVTAFLDRLFYAGGSRMAGKLGACVVSCRRGGASASFDRLNKYFTIARMPVVSSQYWNSIHGNTAEQALQDKEGLQIMRTLGDNMAWLVKCIAAGKAAGIDHPTPEPWEATNFIR